MSDIDGVAFDVTLPLSMSRSSNIAWCTDGRRSSYRANTRDERLRHSGFLDDPLMNDPCVMATPPGCRARPRQVMLTFSASDCFPTDNSCSAYDNPDWYLADVASSSEALCRRYGSGTGSNDGWYGGCAIKPSDGGSTYENAANHWHSDSHGNHDPGRGYNGNAAWYYSEQASNFKSPTAATQREQQQARCVDMSVASGNPTCSNAVIANETVAADNHPGRMYIGGQREQPAYRTHERAGSRGCQWRRPCTTSSGAAMWTSPCNQRLVVQQSETLVTHSH